jgi:hypothetical protein
MDLPAGTPRFSGLVGIAVRDVTPPVGIFSGIWGAADWERSTGIHQPLVLSAVYFGGSGGSGVLLVVMDGGAWRRSEDELAVRSAIMTATGLDADRVVLHLTHTHSGPSLCPEDSEREGGEFIVPMLASVLESAVSASLEAIAGAVQADVTWGLGSSRLAGVRDLPSQGRYLTGWYPDEIADDTVLVARITAADGTLLGTMVNYACHPTTLAWENSQISPDYVGTVRAVVQDATGAPCVFLQGSEGDLAPREQYSGDRALAERHGRGLAHAALAVLTLLPEVQGDATSAQREVVAVSGASTLPLKETKDIPTLAKQFWPDLDPHTRESRVRRAEWRRRQAGEGTHADFPVWVWRLGDGFLVAQPGETYSHFQRELRRRHPEAPVMVLSLANGPIWTYFPIQERFDFNLYEAWHTPFKKGAHEVVVELADDLIGAAAGQPA